MKLIFSDKKNDSKQLVGNAILSRDIVNKYINQIKKFPEDDKVQLEHLILSYQGRREWQSPIEPQTIEATKDAFRITDIHSNPLSQVASLFLDEEEKVLKKASFRRKKKNIEDFIRWSGNIDIDKVTRKIAGDYITRITKNKNPSYDTLRNITADIGSMFSWAENRMDLERNPFHRQKIPKIKRGSQERKLGGMKNNQIP